MIEQIPSVNGQSVNGKSVNGQAAGVLHDPAAELVRIVTPTVRRAVDELHVAAVLESMGVTDQSASDTYSHEDVFTLADAVSRLIPAATGPAEGLHRVPDQRQRRARQQRRRSSPGGQRRQVRPHRRQVADRTPSQVPRHRRQAGDSPAPARSGGTVRVLLHGLLYLLPCLVYPAVLIALGAQAMIRGMVFSTALGWVWGMAASTVAYQFVGHGKDRSAGRALRLLGLGGLVVALLSGILLAATGPGGAGLVAFVVAQMGFQLMAGVLVFYRHEFRLAVAMLPASIAGVALLFSRFSPALVRPALAAGGLSILLLTVTAWVTSMRAPARPDSPEKVTISGTAKGTVPSVYYAALCASFLLLTDSRFLVGPIDLAIAALPLIVGMGLLEWCAYRFTEKIGELWSHAATCAEFRRGAWWLLIKGLTTCLAVLCGLGAILLIILRESGVLSARGAMLVDAHVLLGGAFFLGFVLARHQQFGRLLVIMSLVVAANVLMMPWAVRWLAPDGEVPIFLLCTAVLIISQLITLRASFRHVFYYM